MALVVCVPGHTVDQPMLEAHLLQFVACGRINKWAIPKQFDFVAEKSRKPVLARSTRPHMHLFLHILHFA